MDYPDYRDVILTLTLTLTLTLGARFFGGLSGLSGRDRHTYGFAANY